MSPHAWATVALGTGLIYAVFAIFIFSRIRDLSKLWAYSFWSVGTFLWHGAEACLAMSPTPSEAQLAVRIGYTGIVFLPVAILHLCAEILESPELGRLIKVAYPISCFFAASVWIDHWLLNGFYVTKMSLMPRASWLHPFFIFFVGVLFACYHLQIRRSLRQPDLSPRRREQIRLVQRGLLWYGMSATDFAVNYGATWTPVGVFFCLIGLGHFVYAIYRRQLFDIQIIIRQAMVYSAASTVLACLYAGLLLVATQLLAPFFHGKTVFTIGAACALVALAHPWIRKVQVAVDRFFGRSQSNRTAELMRFSTQLTESQNEERARHLIKEIIEEAFHPEGFILYRLADQGRYDLWIRQGLSTLPTRLEPEDIRVVQLQELLNGHQPAIVFPSVEGKQALSPVHAAVPIVGDSRLLGFILLGAKVSDDLYSEQDLILLRILANHTAAVLERPRLLREFGSGVAHEIKTPLANIALPAELTVLELEDAERHGTLDQFLPKLKDRLTFIVDQAELAGRRMDAMQQISGAVTAEKKRLSLSDIVRRSLKHTHDLARRSNVQLDSDIAPELTVQGDDHQMEILITNLIKNAIEATHAAPTKQVSVDVRSDAGHIILEVGDSGPGIPAGDQSNVFEALYSTKPGTARGMGLYLAKKIVTDHHGRILYERSKDRTIFRVKLPQT